MKKRFNTKRFYYLLKVNSILLFSFLFTMTIKGQSYCEVARDQGEGYITSIKSVTYNGDNSYTIQLRVTHNGCTDGCKSMARYSVEALAGSYSNVFVTLVSGNLNYKNIDLGPSLAGDPFDGFRITGTSGFGNGNPGEFIITYTLSGGLQNQRTQVKAGGDFLLVSFSVEDFQQVLDCQDQKIFPYYTPPGGGKLMTSLIGPELTALYNIYAGGGTYKTDDIFQIYGRDVLVEVHVLNGQYSSLLTLLKSSTYGLHDVVGDPTGAVIIGKIPILNLFSLNDLPAYINYVRPVYPAIPTAGVVTSLGDIAMHSDFARNGFNLSGEGVKIGVISDSYNTLPGNPAQDDVLKGDLPGPGNPENPTPVEVLLDYPFGIKSDEGRAMLQIVHDIAPKAKLAFRTGYVSAEDFANGINELQQDSCDIIVDDITYITQPFLTDGIIAQAVNNVKAKGVTYFSAAGNYGNKSYQSYFNDGGTPPGISGVAHNFAGGVGNDIYQSVSLEEGNYTIVLQWDDGSGSESTNSDLDIYLTNNNGNALFGFNRVNTGGQPIEVLPFTVASGGAQTNIMIVKASGGNNIFFKYVVFRGNLTFNEYGPGVSTLIGQANSEGAIAVGAVLYSNTPAFGVNPPTVASFSSVGGTPVNGVVRNKPEICAPNGVNTTVELGGVNIDGDAFPNFFGTSAAAPHAAGVAALIVQAKSKFYNTGISPDEMKGLLQSTAIDMDPPGFDYSTGAGLIQADEALLQLANPSPQIFTLSYDTTLTPGLEPVQIVVTGKYLTPESEIYFNGSPLSTSTTHQGDTVLVATIPEFIELFPKIQAYNPPLPQTNGTDGGLSNPLYFSTKDKIIVQIDDKQKKYGEVIPEFTATYSLVNVTDSVPLGNAGLFSEVLNRIESVSFETVADDLSNVGVWEIHPSLEDPLNPASGLEPTDSLDIAILNQYDFIFKNGLLTIEPMDLLVVPRDTTFAYGDSIGGFQFNYIFNADTVNPENNVIISPDINAEMLTELKQTHASALVNSTALVNASALVNELGEPLLDASALVNKCFMISEATALADASALVNGTLIDPQALLDATSLVNASALINGAALINASALINGSALINSYDQNGNLVASTSLANSSALINGTSLVNSGTFNENNNSQTIIILSADDVAILDGSVPRTVVLKSINLITGNTVGHHLIVPGALISGNFNVRYGLGNLTIDPAIAQVKANDKFMDKGDPLPAFTATFSGFVNGDDESVIEGLSFGLSPNYTGKAGVYDIIPEASAANYWFIPINGTLYVNPSGPGTKNIKTSLACIEPIQADENGFTYIANFEYENPNNTPIYIPIGPDNIITGSGKFENSQQPVVFLPGVGTWQARFDGNSITWAVSSFNGVHKSSTASNASSTSNKCGDGVVKSANIDGTNISLTDPETFIAYPNPTHGRVNILIGKDVFNQKDITVYDLAGRIVNVNIEKKTGEQVQIDFSGLENGIYFIHLNGMLNESVVKIIKQ